MALFNQLITMFIIVIVGILIKKKNIITDEGIKGLSVILSKIAVPFMVINLLQRDYTTSLLNEFIFICVFTYVMCVVFTIIFLFVSKFMNMDFPDRGLFSVSATYSNVAFMGQPLILAMFGEKALIYCVAVIVIQNVYFATIGVIVITKGLKQKNNIKQFFKSIFLNEIFISAMIGFILFLFRIELPQSVKNVFQYANNSTVFISMIIIGGLLSNANVSNIIKDYKIYVFSIFTLIIMPFTTKLVLQIFTSNDIIINTIIILMGTPTAAAIPAFADRYGADSLKGAEYVFITTILSVVTLPLVAEFLCV